MNAALGMLAVHVLFPAQADLLPTVSDGLDKPDGLTRLSHVNLPSACRVDSHLLWNTLIKHTLRSEVVFGLLAQLQTASLC